MARSRRRDAVPLALALAGLVAGLVLGDRSCGVAPGTVLEKREGIEELIEPNWRPVQELVVAFRPSDDAAIRLPWQPDRWAAGVTTALPADRATYDRLRPGAPVQVRYFPPLPDVARLADQPLPDAVFGPLIESLRESWVILDVLLLAWLAVATRRRWAPALLTTDPRKLGVLALHLAFLQILPLSILSPRDLLPPPAGPLLSTTATVQEVDTVRSVGHTRTGSTQRSPFTLDLPRPFERVQLRFVPAGSDQPVVAVDDVTPGSVPGLAQGATLPIRYAQAEPRTGWIEPARRDHRWENRLYVHAMVTVPFLLLVTVGPGLLLLLRLGLSGLRRTHLAPTGVR